MSTEILVDTADKDLQTYRYKSTAASMQQYVDRKSTSPRPLVRTKRIKPRRTNDDTDSSYQSTYGDVTLPLVLDVPVRLNNSSLTEVVQEKDDTATSSSDAPPLNVPELTVSENASPVNEEGNTISHDCRCSKCHASRGSEIISRPTKKSVDTNQNVTTTSPRDNEQVAKAKHKRRFVLQELLDTERKYVEDITVLVKGYMEQMDAQDLPEGLKRREKIVFGNIRAILAFHRDKFLPDVEKYHDNPQELGSLFTKYEKQLRLYVTYCENKPRSEYLVTEYLSVFQKMASKSKQRLQIQDLLIKPVQRIMKYQLLLKDILKHTERCYEPTMALHKAMDVMHTVPKAANNMMEVGRLQGFEVKLAVHGTVLLQDTLPVAVFKITKPNIRKYKPRRVFLFEQVLIICDLCESSTKGHYYKYRSSIKLSDMRLVPKVFKEPLAFILSNVRDTDTDTYLQAPTVEVKEDWVRQIQSMIDKQTDFLQVLEDPMSSLKLEVPSQLTKKSCRAKSDRPETKQDQPPRSKDHPVWHHHTIH